VLSCCTDASNSGTPSAHPHSKPTEFSLVRLIKLFQGFEANISIADMLEVATCDTWVAWIALHSAFHTIWVAILTMCQTYQVSTMLSLDLI
jgi:ABC-type anion transport system duplicated permease subunit